MRDSLPHYIDHSLCGIPSYLLYLPRMAGNPNEQLATAPNRSGTRAPFGQGRHNMDSWCSITKQRVRYGNLSFTKSGVYERPNDSYTNDGQRGKKANQPEPWNVEDI